MWPDWVIFKKFFATKVAQIFRHFMAYFEKRKFKANTSVFTFWATFVSILAIFYSNIWSHCWRGWTISYSIAQHRQQFHSFETRGLETGFWCQTMGRSNWRLSLVWPDLMKFCHLGKICKSLWALLEGLFSIWQNVQPTLTKVVWFWANFQC